MYLPTPPNRREMYQYLHLRHRWAFIWLLLGSLGIVYGYVWVAIKSWFTLPALLFLGIIIPPVVVNFWLRMHRPRTNEARHKKIVSDYVKNIYPSVDIYLPSCGEPITVLNNTYHYIKRLIWFGVVQVYVLDDDANNEVKALASEYKFHYRVRTNRGELKKAGNLISAFELSADEIGVEKGEFIAVFDADFVPRNDFLLETIPYMTDPKIGIVQTAQYFRIEKSMGYIQRYSGVLQNLFFSYIQPARDVFKAAICAGSNVVYRRSAVAAAGGFARVPIGEDVHSGVKLWRAGFETRYLPLCLATGISPEDFASITNQQTRWCRSSMLVMVDKHFREAPFTWKQRATFWAAFLYYMSSAALLFTGPFPTLATIWFFPELVSSHNYIPIVPAILATLFIFPLLVSGWQPTIYRLCVINSSCHLYAIYYALRGRVAEWVPTGASGKKDLVPRTVSYILRTWIIGVQVLLWTGIALRVSQFGWYPYWATIFLGIVQLYMLAPLLAKNYGVRIKKEVLTDLQTKPRLEQWFPLSGSVMAKLSDRYTHEQDINTDATLIKSKVLRVACQCL